jgi:hypothetical protein
MSKEMRRYVDNFKNFKLNETLKKSKFDIVKYREEIIEIFKLISDRKYNGVYPNFQLQGTQKNIILHFQRFYGEEQFLIKDWLIDGVKYIMGVYGYKYGHALHNTKPVSVSIEIDNPKYDEISDMLDDYEGAVASGKSRKNSNKKIIKNESFDKIENVIGLEVNTLSVHISKVGV